MSKMHVKTWESVDAMLADCNKAAASGRVHTFSDESFVGRKFDGWKDVAAVANQEWPEGLEIIQEMLHEMKKRLRDLPAPKDRRRKKRWADDGDEVCNDRLRSGQEFWSRTERQEVNAPQHVTVFANVGALGEVPWMDLIWRGAAALILCDLLEAAGYRVEFWAVRWSRHLYEDGDPSIGAVCLKGSGGVADTSTVVNALAGWFYRTVFFQSSYSLGAPINRGMGATQLLTTENEFVKQQAGSSKAVVIDGVWNMSAAIDLLDRTLSQFAQQ